MISYLCRRRRRPAKGPDGARIYFGLIAQHVRDTLDAKLGKGAALRYALLCHDTWEQETAPVMAPVTKTPPVERQVPVPVPVTRKVRELARKGKRWSTVTRTETSHVLELQIVDEPYEEMELTGEVRIVREAGDRWGLRYDLCEAIKAAYRRREISRLRATLHAL